MQNARKALIAAVIPLTAVLSMWAVSGELNIPEFSVALSGVITAVLVYLIPNDSPKEKRRNPGARA